MNNLRKLLVDVSQSAAATSQDSTVVEVLAEQEKEQIVEQAKTKDIKDVLYQQTCFPRADSVPQLFSNRIRVLNENSFFPDLDSSAYSNLDFTEPYPYNSEISDNLRLVAQRVWNTQEGRTDYFNKGEFAQTAQVPFEIRILEPQKISDSIFPVTEEIVHLIPNDEVFDRVSWDLFINGGTANGKVYEPLIDISNKFNDYPFDFSKPSEDELDFAGDIAEVDINYNFYIREFEAIASQNELHETMLPNVYSMIAEIENSAGNPNVEDLNHLDGILDDVLIAQKNGDALTFRDNAQYFDEWSRNASKVSNRWTERIQRKFKDIVFQAEELAEELLITAEKREDTFPYSARIKFSTDTTTEFAEILKSSRLFKNFADSFAADLIAENEGLDTNIESNPFIIDAATPETKITRTWDVTRWWNSLSIPPEQPPSRVAQTLDSFDPLAQIEAEAAQNQFEDVSEATIINNLAGLEYGTFIDAFPDLVEESSPNSFYAELLRLILLGKIRQFVEKHKRDYCSILSGETAYSEAVLYRVSKHAVVGGTVSFEPIQNFYLPNLNDIDDISFIDTQIKYGKSYVYKIWTYQLVVGNQYTYELLEAKKGGTVVPINEYNVATFKVRNNPLIKLVEVEKTTFESVRLLDDPPLPPLVDFIPYIGVDNKIAISLCAQTGDLRAKPIAIELIDAKQFIDIRRKQKSTDGLIRFTGDDLVQEFDVFKTRVKPKSYRDFQGQKVATVSTSVASNSVQKTSEMTFLDEIVPNTKYYYTFRSKDIHQHKSNPTHVFEFEMVNNSGAIYPVIKVVDLEKPEVFRTKNFKKYLRLNVRNNQKVVNLEKSRISGVTRPNVTSRIPDWIYLGENNETVWGKKFKLRITSTSSGRKIDINFVVKNAVRDFVASNVALDNLSIASPESIVQILEALDNNK